MVLPVFFERVGRLATRHDAELVQVAGLLGRAVGLPLVALVGIVFGATTIGLVGTTAVFALIGLSWAVGSPPRASCSRSPSPAGWFSGVPVSSFCCGSERRL